MKKRKRKKERASLIKPVCDLTCPLTLNSEIKP